MFYLKKNNTKGSSIDLLPGKGCMSRSRYAHVTKASILPYIIFRHYMVKPTVGEAQHEQFSSIQMFCYLCPEIHVIAAIIIVKNKV
jgi:hypothetical protein